MKSQEDLNTHFVVYLGIDQEKICVAREGIGGNQKRQLYAGLKSCLIDNEGPFGAFLFAYTKVV